MSEPTDRFKSAMIVPPFLCSIQSLLNYKSLDGNHQQPFGQMKKRYRSHGRYPLISYKLMHCPFLTASLHDLLCGCIVYFSRKNKRQLRYQSFRHLKSLFKFHYLHLCSLLLSKSQLPEVISEHLVNAGTVSFEYHPPNRLPLFG